MTFSRWLKQNKQKIHGLAIEHILELISTHETKYTNECEGFSETCEGWLSLQEENNNKKFMRK